MRIPRLTYSNVTATVALFAALGGTSYAAITFTGANIRNGTVTGSDVKNESLKGADVDNGTLTGSDLKSGSVTTSDIDDASLLAADFKPGEIPAGPQGPTGLQGPAGATNVVSRRDEVIVAPGQAERVEVSCLPGETVVGGGAGFGGIAIDDRIILFSEPLEADDTLPEDGEPATQWAAGGGNASGLPRTLTVQVLCASP